MLCLLLMMTVAAAEYVYNVTIVMDGLGIIPLETSEPPRITEDGVVIIKVEDEYYFASIDNVIVMVTEVNPTQEEQWRVPDGGLIIYKQANKQKEEETINERALRKDQGCGV